MIEYKNSVIALACAVAFGVFASPVFASEWRTVISSDFATDGVLPAPWSAYNFSNSNPAAGWYLPSHVVISGGVLRLVQKYDATGPARNIYYTATGGGWYQGTITADGVADSVDHRTTVRMRAVSVGGIGSYRNMPLWFPIGGTAANDLGEENYYEQSGGGLPWVFMHALNNASIVYWRYPLGEYLTQWHTYRFQRLNHRITIWVDDMVIPLWESPQYTSRELPDTLKKPVFQQENDGYQAPAGTTGSDEIQLDYVTVDVPAYTTAVRRKGVTVTGSTTWYRP